MSKSRCCALGLIVASALVFGVGTSPKRVEAQRVPDGPSSVEAGRILGKINDAQTGEPIAGAQVYLVDQSAGTLTNLDGRYVLSRIPAGTHALRIEFLGYGTKTVTGVDVNSGRNTVMNVTLDPEAVQLDAIEVTADRERGSSAFLLDQRRTSSALVDAVGAAEISRTPDSDAAEVARRMTGVTVTDGKYVFVRGLGQRYSQTSFDGAPLPSPEPEKETVPLDLFPSDFLESLSTQKSYTPDRPADFSGGAVEIKMKDFPTDLTYQLGISSSVNSATQLGSGKFLTYSGGHRDWLGLDDGSRELPDVIRNQLGGLGGDRLPRDNPDLLRTVGLSLPRQFDPVATDAPLNRSFDGSVGGTHQLFDRDLGFFLAGTYSDSYRLRDEVERKFRVASFDPTLAPDQRQANVDYSFHRATRSVRWGVLSNAQYLLTPRHKIGLGFTVNLNTDDEARTYQGANQEDLGGWVRSDRLRFTERLLTWGQLNGEHQLPLSSTLTWKATVAQARRNEPGLREALYLGNDSTSTLYLENVGESGRYLYSDLTDDDRSFQADWELPFEIGGRPGSSLKVGGMHRNRHRDFASRRLNWNFLGSLITDIEDSLTPDQIVGTPPGPGQLRITDVVEPGDQYLVDDKRNAGYAMFSLFPTERLRAVVGTRVETYDLSLVSRDSLLADQSQTDWAPSVNLIYSFNSHLKLRAAASRTVDRPEFRELAPFQFTEAASVRQIFGNPNLHPASIHSGDLRMDWFPGPGELVSVGGYYKRIDEPIEEVFVTAASTAYSYENADKADVYGVELDTRLGGRHLSDALRPLHFQGNFSWIQSRVHVRETLSFKPTNLKRPLEGQARYVLNLGANWAVGRWETGLFFNRFGERLTAAGGFGVPDIMEQPRNQLDASFKLHLPSGLTAKLQAENLLDAQYLFQQSANGVTQVQRAYKVGRSFSLGLNWRR